VWSLTYDNDNKTKIDLVNNTDFEISIKSNDKDSNLTSTMLRVISVNERNKGIYTCSLYIDNQVEDFTFARNLAKSFSNVTVLGNSHF